MISNRTRKVILTSLSIILIAAALAWAATEADIAAHPHCVICGMDRLKFAHSRMLVTYDDDTEVGYCSIHCVAVDNAANLDRVPVRMQVGHYDSRQLIDAEKAAWVIGGDRPGVMTKVAKWAFARASEAKRFIQKNGGRMGDMEVAIKASYEDMYADTKMIREKRKMMRAKKMKPGHGHE